MKRNRLMHFLLVLFPGMLIGILVSFLLGMWNEWDVLLKWEIAILIGVGLAILLTLVQTRSTPVNNEKKQ